MLNYKRIIKSREMRFKILGMFNFIPDNVMVKFQYRFSTGRHLNLGKPKRYTEKLQWYKLFYRTPLMTQCADKYLVREYVKSKGFEGILNELYGVFEKPDDINFGTLPTKFVIKINNGSGTNIFCKDKNKLNIKETKNTLDAWLSRSILSAGREWAYNNISPLIIVERYLEDKSNQFGGINDYKFLCMNGEVKYVVLDVGRYTDHRRNFYDPEWNFIDAYSDHPNWEDKVPRPEGLAEMLEIAKIFAKDFLHVRVDLYWINNKVVFGELTFYPWSGYVTFSPDKFDFDLGEKFILP